MQTEWKANTGKFALLNRSVKTLLLARKVHKSVQQLEKELAATHGLDEEDVKARWKELHRRNAKMFHQHILKHRGFLIKVGQALSIRAGEMPVPWVEELQGLQDDLPVSNFKEVRQTVRADLGRPLEQIFSDFADRPIASASVAQAHLAHLRSSGQKVCVKVQHRGVASMVGTDLATIEFIAERAAKYHPDSFDSSDLIREWRRASREEVDFRLEAKNANDATKGLLDAGLDVGCPEPINELCGKRVLTMAFIEGWKITEVDRLPLGTDRAAICWPLVDAFATLAFEIGLIHGDPHPGNVFAEAVPAGPDGPRRIRAALLDWGIVQRLTLAERVGAARWIVASLAQDRVLYLRALEELGFEFDAGAHPDSQSFNAFLEAAMGSSMWWFRDTIPTSAQLHFLEELHKHQDKQDNLNNMQGKFDEMSSAKVLNKIPGVVLFFSRGLEMLQSICGTLEVVVPFSKVILARAMPLLQAADAHPTPAMPAPIGCSELEHTVRLKLQEFVDSGAILGAQVAVMNTEDGEMLCEIAAGRTAIAGGPMISSMLLPLGDLTAGVILRCLLSVLAKLRDSGQSIDLDTPVAQIWSDFAQNGKGNITIGKLVRQRAGLIRVFPRGITFRAYCNEFRMEASIASSFPEIEPDAEQLPCPVIGALGAALLRRLMSKGSAEEAVFTLLKEMNMHQDIAYTSTDSRMVFAGRRPRDSMSMEYMYEWLEGKMNNLEKQAENTPPEWLSWHDLALERPNCTDPHIINRECVRSGEGPVPGKGLRATAVAVSRLFGDELEITEQFRNMCVEPSHKLKLETEQAWNAVGTCPEISTAGLRLLRFRTVPDREEVLAYGWVDGATGSYIVRFPTHSVSILLTSTDSATRHVGRELLTAVAGHFGLTLDWPAELPDGERKKKNKKRNPAFTDWQVTQVHSEAKSGYTVGKGYTEQVAKLQAKIATLSKAVGQLNDRGHTPVKKHGKRHAGDTNIMYEGNDDSEINRTASPVRKRDRWDSDEATPLAAGQGKQTNLQDDVNQETEVGVAEVVDGARGISGNWVSVETSDLEDQFDTFDLSPETRNNAAEAKRFLSFHVAGDDVTMHSATKMETQVVDDSKMSFSIGREFQAEQPPGCYFSGIAHWIYSDDVDAAPDLETEPARSLIIEKHFLVEGRPMVLEEHFEIQGEQTLSLTTTVRTPSEEFPGQVEEQSSTTIFKRESEPPAPAEMEGSAKEAGPWEKVDHIVDGCTKEVRRVGTGLTSALARARPCDVLDGALPGCGFTLLAAGLAISSLLGTSFQVLGRGVDSARSKSSQQAIALRQGMSLQRSIMDSTNLEAKKHPGAGPSKVKTPQLPGRRVCENRGSLGQSDGSLCRVPIFKVGANTSESSSAAPSVEEKRLEMETAASQKSSIPGASLSDIGPSASNRPPSEAIVHGRSTLRGALKPQKSSRYVAESASSAKVERPAARLAPKIADPRCPSGTAKPVSIVAFVGYDPTGTLNDVFGNGFLGSCYELGAGTLAVEAPCMLGQVHKFRNAEAAFHALKFWPLAPRFCDKTALAAVKKQEQLQAHVDETFSGFKCAWQAALAVSKAKFAPGSDLAGMLLNTGDAFLLAYDADPDNGQDERGKSWYNGADKFNFFGLQLMLVRDELSGCGLGGAWSKHIVKFLRVADGTIVGPRKREWREAVRRATAAVDKSLQLAVNSV